MSERTIMFDVDVDTETFVKRIRVIAKHLESMAEELELIDQEEQSKEK